jgi:hypothetical protein
VIFYETQSPFALPERTGDRRMLEAAVHGTDCPVGFVIDGACNSTGGLLIELDAERASI